MSDSEERAHGAILSLFLRPEQFRQLMAINQLAGEPWRQTLQDVVDVALAKYQGVVDDEVAKRTCHPDRVIDERLVKKGRGKN